MRRPRAARAERRRLFWLGPLIWRPLAQVAQYGMESTRREGRNQEDQKLRSLGLSPESNRLNKNARQGIASRETALDRLEESSSAKQKAKPSIGVSIRVPSRVILGPSMHQPISQCDVICDLVQS